MFFVKILLSFSLLISSSAFAEIAFSTIWDRCTEQNLGPNEGSKRNQWALKCFPTQKEFIDFFGAKNFYALVQSKLGSWQGPIDPNADCADWSLKSFCLASCYLPDQQLLFESGTWPILEALERGESMLVVLKPGSSLQHPELQLMRVQAYTRSWQEGNEVIRIIRTQSGGELKVTENHPILLSTGVMVEARELELSDLLVKKNGRFDPIISLENISYFGKVYNISPNSSDPIENIVVAQGFLVGSGAYQHLQALNSLMGKKFMRSLLTPDAEDMIVLAQ